MNNLNVFTLVFTKIVMIFVINNINIKIFVKNNIKDSIVYLVFIFLFSLKKLSLFSKKTTDDIHGK
jgi:hypothetical protein